jgi:acyl carrier protein
VSSGGAPGAADERELVARIAALLRDVAGEDEHWLAGIGPHTRLDGDLLLESVELAELGDALARRYGEHVDLVGHVAALTIDEIIALTVADVAAYVASQGLSEQHSSEQHRDSEQHAGRSGP